jgi:hypothetical protein
MRVRLQLTRDLSLRLLQAKVFMLQLACKRTQFSACGFFHLNLALTRPVRNSNSAVGNPNKKNSAL